MGDRTNLRFTFTAGDESFAVVEFTLRDGTALDHQAAATRATTIRTVTSTKPAARLLRRTICAANHDETIVIANDRTESVGHDEQRAGRRAARVWLDTVPTRNLFQLHLTLSARRRIRAPLVLQQRTR